MIIKLMGFVLAVISVELFLIGVQSPADPLLLVISSNPVVMSLRIAVVATAIFLAYKKRFKYKITHKVLGWLGGLMAFGGLLGTLSQTIAAELSVYIKYLDFWMLCLLGIMFVVISLSTQPGWHRLKIQKTLIRHLPKILESKLNPHLPASGLTPARGTRKS